MADYVTIMANADADAQSLSKFVSGGKDEWVTRRLAPNVHTLEYYISILSSYETQLDGVIATAEGDARTKIFTAIDAYQQKLNYNLTSLTAAADTKITETANQLIASQAQDFAQATQDAINRVTADLSAVASDIVTLPSGRNLSDKANDTWSIKDFYIPELDLGDYTNALNRAIASGVAGIDGGGQSYDFVAGLVCNRSNFALSNMTLSLKSATAGSIAVQFAGNTGNAVNVTTSTLFSLTVANAAAFNRDDYILVNSTDKWSPTVTMGETTQVESIDYANNILYLRFALIASYSTTNAATVKKLNLLDGIRLSNIKVNGIDNNELANSCLSFKNCLRPLVDNLQSYDFDRHHVAIDTCVGTRVKNGNVQRTGNFDGVDYGIVISNANLDTIVDGVSGTALRHLVSFGGYSGVNKHNTVANCRAFNTLDAAYDSHSAAADVAFLFNHSNQSGSSNLQQDGIIAQCANLVAIGNQINNPRRHGIVFSPELNPNVYLGQVGLQSAHNRLTAINTATGSAYGITVDTKTTAAGIDFVSSIDDTVSGFDTSHFITANKSDIRSISISSPKTPKACRLRGVHIIAYDNLNIKDVQINDAKLSLTSNSEVVYLQAAVSDINNPSLVVGRFNGWQVNNSRLSGGGSSTAIRVTNATNGSESGNVYDGCTNFLVTDTATTKFNSTTRRAGKTAWAGATIANGAQVTVAVTVNGIKYGDLVDAAITVSAQGCVVSGYMSGTNTVTVTITNNTGVSRTIAACDVIASYIRCAV